MTVPIKFTGDEYSYVVNRTKCQKMAAIFHYSR